MLRIGLLGFSGTGKSTLFQLLSGVTPDPGAVIRGGQVGTVILPDDRIEKLRPVFRSERTVAPHVELLDTAGVDPSGAQDPAHVLGMLRQVDALLLVLRADEVGGLREQLNRLRAVLAESDLGVLQGRLERIEATLKKPRPTAERQELEAEKGDVLATMTAIKEQGSVPVELQKKAERRGYALLLGKPMCPVLNVSYDAIATAQAAVPEGIAIDAALELEFIGLPEDERAELMREFGVDRLHRDELLHDLKEKLGLVVFYTGNERELRAWVALRCTTAPRAAGMIHSDMERGFIRAEVARADDLISIGSDRQAHAQGAYHIQGKDYHVQDGDVLYVRFSV